MQSGFLQSYLTAFRRIEGWFVYDAALMFMAYNQLARSAGVVGDTLEIGVYFGLSAIAIAALRGTGRKMYAIDLFEHNESNVSTYGAGRVYRKAFEDNMQSMFGTTDFLVVIAAASGQLSSENFSRSFSFCHIDGGHSPEETYSDLKFASDILLPGGLLALDDYFNPQNPGVCEGANAFGRDHKGVLQPVAIGFHKVLFAKSPAPIDFNAEFSKTFPHVPHLPVGGPMWGCPVYLFRDLLREYFDLQASSPDQLTPKRAIGKRAMFTPEQSRFGARPGEKISVPVAVKNTSADDFPYGEGVFGLSYHLLSAEGDTIQHDNQRSWLERPLQPSEQLTTSLQVTAPDVPGRYKLEVDLVWEGVMWFKDAANPTCLLDLEVG